MDHPWHVPPSYATNNSEGQNVKGEVLYDSAQVLPCAKEELCCETNLLDHYAYNWDYPDNCLLSVLRTEEVNIVKQRTKNYIISGPDSTSKFVVQVKKQSSETIWKSDGYLPN